ncbi:MAG: hypothetical protein GC159_08920 [Phycisphaera sp.]|nr:hypothetical protein [Phycisphaera sp.]
MRNSWILFVCVAAVVFGPPARAADDQGEAHLEAPAGWASERIELPPSFAPELGLKGAEEIRFAPGMFKPGEEDFFSYVLVFTLTDPPQLTRDRIGKELLTYYRGLAKAVSRGKIAVDGFSIAVEPDEAKAEAEATAKRYVATLKWIEPFKTSKAQTLRIEVRVWATPKDGRTYMFLCISPQQAEHAIWATMRRIRDAFVKRTS